MEVDVDPSQAGSAETASLAGGDRHWSRWRPGSRLSARWCGSENPTSNASCSTTTRSGFTDCAELMTAGSDCHDPTDTGDRRRDVLHAGGRGGRRNRRGRGGPAGTPASSAGSSRPEAPGVRSTPPNSASDWAWSAASSWAPAPASSSSACWPSATPGSTGRGSVPISPNPSPPSSEAWPSAVGQDSNLV